MHCPLRHLAYDFGDVFRLDAACGQPSRTVDIGLRHRPAGIRLERQRVRHPARAKIARQCLVVALGCVRKAMEQSVHTLEHRPRTDESSPRQQGGADAGLRRPAGMQPLGPGAFGQVFDDPAGHTAGDTECTDNLPAVETERGTNTCGRAHRAEDGGWMKARLVDGFRHHHA